MADQLTLRKNDLTHSNRWMTVENSSQARVPTDGRGGSSNLVANSEVANAQLVVVEGVLIIEADDAGMISIATNNAPFPVILEATYAATAKPIYVQFGRRGALIPSGFIARSLTVAGAPLATTSYMVFYRNATGQPR